MPKDAKGRPLYIHGTPEPGVYGGHSLVVTIDDVADTISAAVSRLDVYGIEQPTDDMRAIVRALDEMAAQLEIALQALHTLKPAVVREARKFGKEFNPWALYKHVSGMNAVRLRKLLTSLQGEDYPADPRAAYRQIRQVTMSGQLEIRPHAQPSVERHLVDLDADCADDSRGLLEHSVNANVSSHSGVEPRNRPEKCGFSRTIRAGQRHDVAVVDTERELR